MSLKIVQLDNSDINQLERWDKFIDETAEGSLFHKSYWLLNSNTAKKSSADSVEFWVIENANKEWVAAIPITYRKVMGQKVLVMPYFTPYLGPVFKIVKNIKTYKDISSKKEINGLIADKIKKEFRLLFYTFSYKHKDMQPYMWKSMNTTLRYTYILELDDLDKAWSNLEQKRRNDINRGIKLNHKLEWGFEKNLDKFFQLNEMTFKRQGVSNVDSAFMKQQMINAYKNNSCDICVAYDVEGNPLASCVLVWDTKRAYYIGGGISGTDSCAMSLIIWEAIKYTKTKLNLLEFDFEGSMIESIEKFFRKFGGNIVPYYGLVGKPYIIKKLIK